MTHGGAAGGKAGAGGSAGAGTGGGGAPAACAVPATRIWKLTPTQYTRTVQDLLKTTLVPTADLRGSLSSPDGFSNKADVEQMSEPHTGELRRLAELMAREAIGKKAELSPCLGVAPLADACVRAFIADFGGRAFRRPLETGAYDEAGAYLAFFKDRQTARGSDIALRLLIESFLLSPSFLFRTELGLDTARPAGSPERRR